MTKVCSKCREEKPATREFYHPDARASTGCQSECRQCELNRRRERGVKPVILLQQERLTAAQRKTSRCCTGCEEIKPLSDFARNSKNLDGVRSRCRSCESSDQLKRACTKSVTEKRCNACGETKPASDFGKNTKWARDGLTVYRKECECERVKAYCLSNHEKALDGARRSRLKHLPARLASTQAWRVANPEMVRAITSRYKKTEKGRLTSRLKEQKRRAMILNLPQTKIDRAAWLKTLEVFDNRCAYCLVSGVPLHIDHVIAIARGGDNSPDNLVPACQSCNSIKHSKPIFMMAGR